MTPRHGPSARLPAVLSAITARVSGVCPGRGPRELSLGVTRRPGWCRRLSGHLALVAQRIEHLTTDLASANAVLTCGNAGGNRAELLESDSLKSLLRVSGKGTQCSPTP